jgi:O-6-methylguanine DNA methyltransferase
VNALPIKTGEGVFIALYSASGLCELRFPERTSAGAEAVSNSDVMGWHEATMAALAAILRGTLPDEIPPLDLSDHTPFRRRVWREMQRIPLGQTVSYAELARRIGQPNAMRAVGGACGANPIPLIIPCHRVLAAGQRLGGFSGGLDWKRKLLAIEKIDYANGGAGARLGSEAGQGFLVGLGGDKN